MADRTIKVDVLIVGGGIAGLWTLARLRRIGFAAMLVEKHALGAGQTIASQGIIHGGVKYALAGEASEASRSIAHMPRIWDECLEGRGEVDLSAARVLSREQVLWTTPGLVSRIAGFGASKVVRARAERAGAEDGERPAAFTGAPAGVDVYRVPEIVLDPRSVVAALGGPAHAGSYAVLGTPHFRAGATGGGSSHAACIETPGGTVTVHARAVLLAAGAGNAALLAEIGVAIPGVVQQNRPLHMVMARPAPVSIFGHCMSGAALPRLTITTIHDPTTGEAVWTIGGAISEGEGVKRDSDAQIAECRRELAACLPWLDLSGLRFAARRWDRAEGVARRNEPPTRPDGPTVARAGGVIAAWPTKLAFAPAVAARIIDLLGEAGVGPSGAEQNGIADLPAAPIAPFPWEEAPSWS